MFPAKTMVGTCEGSDIGKHNISEETLPQYKILNHCTKAMVPSAAA